MGLLDDAIRDHLELKRRHGAAEDDVKRQEAEALGPVRREVPESADEGPDSDGSADFEATAEEAQPQVPEPVELKGAAVEEDISELLDPLVPEEAPTSLDEDRTRVYEPEPVAAEPPPPEPPLAEPEPELSEPEPLESEPEPESEPAPAAGDEVEGEDVLEETPDFLQETPEHDRLWFEQKPPRDFDFD